MNNENNTLEKLKAEMRVKVEALIADKEYEVSRVREEERVQHSETIKELEGRIGSM